MKNLNEYITEKFKINSKNIKKQYNYHPTTRDELKNLIDKLIQERGNKADLNDIDTSEITDMEKLFYASEFNGDISEWDVSNVTNMYKMFTRSKFNGDLTKWNTTKLEKNFAMFKFCPLNTHPPKWYKD